MLKLVPQLYSCLNNCRTADHFKARTRVRLSQVMRTVAVRKGGVSPLPWQLQQKKHVAIAHITSLHKFSTCKLDYALALICTFTSSRGGSTTSVHQTVTKKKNVTQNVPLNASRRTAPAQRGLQVMAPCSAAAPGGQKGDLRPLNLFETQQRKTVI